jgi:hypothetical protein
VVPTRGVVPVHDDEDRLAQRLQHRLARRAGPELRHEGLGPGGRRRDDRLLLAREVVEEGAQGDVGLGRDLLDREALDPVPDGEPQRRVAHGGAGGLLLALPASDLVHRRQAQVTGSECTPKIGMSLRRGTSAPPAPR